MSKVISGSPNIAVLDSRVIADLCIGKFYIDVGVSNYIGDGAGDVLGARVKITNPFGVVVKDYASGYEIAPSLVGGMDTIVNFNIPLQASNYQWGTYTIDVKLTDSDNKEYVVTKSFDLKCIPNGKPKVKYGTLGAQINGSCANGKVAILLNTPPVYAGKIFQSQVTSLTLQYPTVSNLPAEESTTGNFSVKLFEGEYLLTGETCVTYNLGDNVFVKIKFKINVTKTIRCGINNCVVLPALIALNDHLNTDCSDDEKLETSARIVESLSLIKLIELGTECGEDISSYVETLATLLGIPDTEITTVIINNSPSNDFVIEGCGFEREDIGLTTKYTINNFEYIVTVDESSKNYIVVSESVQDECKKIQTINFNIDAVYKKIKNIINTSNEEKNFFSTIVFQSLINGGVNWTQLGLTESQVTNMTPAQLFNYLLSYVKSCCECLAKITDHSAESEGGNVTIAWTGENLYAVEIYIDGEHVATVLESKTSYTMIGLADSQEHTYTLIPKNANGKLCTPVADQFNFFGCAAINPPSLSTSVANGVACPYDLTQLVAELPLGVTAEWHNANNTLPSSLVGNPEAVSAGVYWAFAKDANGCYSTGSSVTVTCEAAVSCTAPQNLMVTPVIGGFLVSFQSATNNPPVYGVQRRLKADPDVAGSYTTIGTPNWNASTNRWEILDGTAVNNTLYTYRATSLCANDAKPFVDYNFANLVCPVITLVPHENSIDFSFVNSGGGIDRYEVTLYNSTGLIAISTQNFTPVFTNPVAGTFADLDANQNYKVRVRMLVGGHGGYSKDCPLQNVATEPVNVCPEITDIEGEGFGETA